MIHGQAPLWEIRAELKRLWSLGEFSNEFQRLCILWQNRAGYMLTVADMD